MNPMTIEQARVEDLPEILELQRLSYRQEAEIYNDYSIPPLTQDLEEITVEFGRRTFLVTRDSGRIVGSVRYHVDGGTCYIGRLIVDPAYQNRGIGTALMRDVENKAKTSRFELFTGESSEKNLYLYRKLGYRDFRTEKTPGSVTIVYLEKPIDG